LAMSSEATGAGKLHQNQLIKYMVVAESPDATDARECRDSQSHLKEVVHLKDYKAFF